MESIEDHLGDRLSASSIIAENVDLDRQSAELSRTSCTLTRQSTLGTESSGLSLLLRVREGRGWDTFHASMRFIGRKTFSG